MHFVQGIDHQISDDHHRAGRKDGQYQREYDAYGNDSGFDIATVFLRLIYGVERSHHRDYSLGRGVESEEETERKQTLPWLGDNIHQRGLDVFIDFQGNDILHKVQDIVCRDHRDEVLEIGDQIEQKQNQWKKRNRIVESHRTGSFADIVFFELLDEDPGDIIQVLVRVTEVYFFQMPCL